MDKIENKWVESVLINAGSNNGIKFRDRFYVYSFEPGYTDPVTQYSLGEKIKRIGVVWVMVIEDRFCWAIVEAGKGFKTKQIIRPYKKEQRFDQPTPWWAFISD